MWTVLGSLELSVTSEDAVCLPACLLGLGLGSTTGAPSLVLGFFLPVPVPATEFRALTTGQLQLISFFIDS